MLLEASDWAPDVLLALDLLRRFAPRVVERRSREEALIRQGRLLAVVGRLEEAEQLLSVDGASMQRMYLRALTLYQLGALEESLDVLRAALSDLAAKGAPAEVTAAAPQSGGGPGADPAATGPHPAPRGQLEARVYLLMAHIYRMLARTGEAESLYLLLQKLYGDFEVAPAAHLEYQLLLQELGRSSEAAAVGEELRQRFPASPEAALGRGQGDGRDPSAPVPLVAAAPSPSWLLPAEILRQPQGPASAAGPGPEARTADRPAAPAVATGSSNAAKGPSAAAAAPASPAAAPAAPAAGDGMVPGQAPGAARGPAGRSAPAPVRPDGPAANALVQTGSFRDRENAQYMLRDLKAVGFAAEIREKSLDGTVYYRVVIGPAMTPEEAQKLMLRLKVAGFEGFLLFLD